MAQLTDDHFMILAALDRLAKKYGGYYLVPSVPSTIAYVKDLQRESLVVGRNPYSWYVRPSAKGREVLKARKDGSNGT